MHQSQVLIDSHRGLHVMVLGRCRVFDLFFDLEELLIVFQFFFNDLDVHLQLLIGLLESNHGFSCDRFVSYSLCMRQINACK